MSTANLIKAFNKLVFQFNDDLIAVFPQESDFKLSKHTFELLDKVNYKKIFASKTTRRNLRDQIR